MKYMPACHAGGFDWNALIPSPKRDGIAGDTLQGAPKHLREGGSHNTLIVIPSPSPLPWLYHRPESLIRITSGGQGVRCDGKGSVDVSAGQYGGDDYAVSGAGRGSL